MTSTTSELQFHPASELFPLLSEKDLAELAQDIAGHGLHHPVILYEGKILDGRNRYLACCRIGVKPSYEEWKGGNPWEYVWSENAARRHLEPGTRALIREIQRRESAAWEEQQAHRREAANRARSEAAEARRQPNGTLGTSAVSRDTGQVDNRDRYQLAAEAGVSTATAARAQSLINARPDLATQVQKGEISLTEALRRKKKDEVTARTCPLPTGKYRVLYADPPWTYGNSGLPSYGHASHHYPDLSIADLCALPIRETAADDAVLFLWVTAPLLEECFRVIHAWGFSYKTCFVWDKVRHNFGHYNSVRHEFLLVCTRGSCTPDTVRLFDSVQTIERSDVHSEKPEEFRRIIETLYVRRDQENFLEIFARWDNQRRPEGWDGYGNEC